MLEVRMFGYRKAKENEVEKRTILVLGGSETHFEGLDQKYLSPEETKSLMDAKKEFVEFCEKEYPVSERATFSGVVEIVKKEFGLEATPGEKVPAEVVKFRQALAKFATFYQPLSKKAYRRFAKANVIV